MISRRQTLVIALLVFTGMNLGRRTYAELPLVPLALRVSRRTGWEELMARNQCIVGDVYLTSAKFPISDKGTRIAYALELPWRNNMNSISAVPKGEYRGYVRTDGDRGWRIELVGTGPRKTIQLHIGNRPSDTDGCILLGTGTTTDGQCFLPGSKDAMAKLQAIYGEKRREVVVLIE